MHTAVCTFQDREAAERAREELLRAGFRRRDVHLEPRGQDADLGRHAGEDPRGWEGTDREIAADRNMVDRVAGFFVHLFGQDHPEGHDRTYGDAVERGHYVLVVDAEDDAEAQRARTVLHGHAAADLNVVHRPEHRPLREILGTRGDEDDPGFAGSYHDRASAFDDRHEGVRERALATGEIGEERPLDLRDPDQDQDQDRVGLRYADKDKPGRA